MLFREFIAESFSVFLLEYSREKTLEAWNTKLETRIKLETDLGKKPISTAYTLESLERSDPTPNKQYVQWLVKAYVNGSWLEDLISRGKDNLIKFELLKKKKIIRPEHADIGKFKLLKNLEDAMEQYEIPEEENTDKGSSSVIEDNQEFKAIVPHTEKAACYYGQGTRWCTAAKNGNMFKHYDDDNDLVIIIPKKPEYTGEKYQLFNNDSAFLGYFTIMNEKDEEVKEEVLTNRFKTLDLESLFQKALSFSEPTEDANKELQKRVSTDKLTPQRAYQLITRPGYRDSYKDLIKFVLKDSDITVKYLDWRNRNRLKHDMFIPEIEKALIAQHNLSGILLYAVYYMHARWPEAEHILLESPINFKILYNYITNVVKKRWPEAEKAMLDAYTKSTVSKVMDVDEPYYLLAKYTSEIIDGSWKEYEEIILARKDKVAAKTYLRKFDFPEEVLNFQELTALAKA